ncbi:hypothetical protein ACTD5D_41230 [Nocardia takedensis]|uniref:hypothetical protein n=1 Tax=Nocardia takedensis TaxID=259390 RepID=UPI003F76E61D
MTQSSRHAIEKSELSGEWSVIVIDAESEAEEESGFELWLGHQYGAALAGLVANLDLEAGLQETLLQAQHDELVRSLRGVINIEAGLAAIAPATKLAPRSSASSDGFSPDREVALQLSVSFRAMPLMVRLELRHVCSAGVTDAMVHARWIADAFALVSRHRLLQGGIEEVSEPASFVDKMSKDITHLSDGVAEIVESLVYVLIEEESARILDGADAIAMKWLVSVRRLLRTAVQRIGHAIAVFREKVEWQQVAEWRRISVWLADIGGAAKVVHKNIDHFAVQLVEINDLVNNFIGEDFRYTDLVGVQLAGLYWSTETRWPEAWQKQIERDSFPIGDGIFEIRGGIDTQHEALIAP